MSLRRTPAHDCGDSVGRRRCQSPDLRSRSMTTAPEPHQETDHRPEWVGGIVTLPSYVTEGDKTYRPSVILWIDAATEMILGTSVIDPPGFSTRSPGIAGRLRVQRRVR